LKGEVTLVTEAELAGLGPSTGPAIPWTIPEHFAAMQPVGLAGVFFPNSDAGSSGHFGSNLSPWLFFFCLVIFSAILVSRLKWKDRS
jgi:hypothetical protein